MSMAKMTPDTHNGKQILRPVVHEGDGIPKLASSAVFHPPSILIEHPPEPVGLLVERAAHQIVSMRAMTTSELKMRLHAFAADVIENQRRKGATHG